MLSTADSMLQSINTNTFSSSNPAGIDVPKGIDVPIDPNCKCSCHYGDKLGVVLMQLEEKIGIIKCAECTCYDKRT